MRLGLVIGAVLLLASCAAGYTVAELQAACVLVPECATGMFPASLSLFTQLVARNTFPPISAGLSVNETMLVLLVREEQSGRCPSGSTRVLQEGLLACECNGGPDSLCGRCPPEDAGMTGIVLLATLIIGGCTVKLWWLRQKRVP